MAERRNRRESKESRPSSGGHVDRLGRAARAGAEALERRLFLDATAWTPARRALFPEGEPTVPFVAMGPYALTTPGPAAYWRALTSSARTPQACPRETSPGRITFATHRPRAAQRRRRFFSRR